MPRGRHRHSPPLHKLLPPSAVAGAAVVCAAAAWLPGDPVIARLLAAAAAAAAVTGAVLMRSWDRNAGLKVAELDRARAADQWKAEERTAELETDLEESRALRSRLEAKLRAKRVELAGLRGEHADLLRRYATAETERASALEGRRVLALETSGTSGTDAKALPAAGSTPTPEAFRRAAQALRDLPRNAAAQQARRTAEAARARDLAERARETEEPQGKHAAAAGTEQHTRTAAATPALPPATTVLPAVPVAAAVVPYAARRPAPRPEGGFDFFGTQKAAAVIEDVQNSDLADVVGEEVLASGTPLLTPVAAPAVPAPPRAIGQVIDLTAHDETEQLDVAELRDAISS
ncbi:hypothetical protein [Streptomyces sp. TLI_105]|uniref:hypothetical protein n=1 Tax=Streptomyces sp. TLI_105 TaxID=1881019 RepID=UPI0008986E6B|nr:hypothetical protein [Streptomyces sp. TLI_105]SED11208.1 hypothetical protein SAMN05428939_4238 [Streptomyces sp. TLI_105]